MIKVLIIAIVATSFFQQPLMAQKAGIQFEEGLSWDSVKAKAKQEGKYIFVDCYATWCGPCKLMDKETYPDSGLGEFMNPLFVSVKAQMDSTKNDNSEVQSWYGAVHELKTRYHIDAFPTYLFFSPDGVLVNKAIGACKANGFVRLALDARQTENQTYIQLEKFKRGELADASVPSLINNLENAGDHEQAILVAQTYIHNYLLKLPKDLLFKKDNIRLLGKYLKSSKDEGFSVFYRYPKLVDKVVGNDYDKSVLWTVILREDVNPKLYKDNVKRQPLTTRPDWTAIAKPIQEKFGEKTAEGVILYARIKWYKQQKDWTELVKASLEQLEKFGPDADLNSLNNTLYNVFFEHSSNKNVLTKAIQWQKLVLDKYPDEPDYIDTYANLLYKLGRKDEAIDWEIKALNLVKEHMDKASNDYKQGISHSSDRITQYKNQLDDEAATLQKMKSGQPTWPMN